MGTIAQARKQAFWLRFTGSLIALFFLGLILLTLVKMVYVHSRQQSDFATVLLGNFFDTVGDGIAWAYNANSFIRWLLDIVWPYLPMLDMQNLSLRPVLGILFLYVGVWIGLALSNLGIKTANKVKAVKDALETESMMNSARPGVQRSYKEMRHIVQMETPSFWSSMGNTFLFPLVVGLLVAGVSFAFGWN